MERETLGFKKAETTQSSERLFIQELFGLFKDSSQFDWWVLQFLGTYSKKEVLCRHREDILLLMEEVPCSSIGTRDKNTMILKRSTIWTSACKFLRISRQLEQKAHVKAHLLAFLASKSYETPTLAYKALIADTKLVIAHRCGCGISATKQLTCTESAHLQLVLPEENRIHIAYHDLLAFVQPKQITGPESVEDFVTLCRVFEQKINTKLF
jgi:hypothetical protein